MNNNEKKKMILFLAVAFGMVIITNIFMFIGVKTGKNGTALVQAQMLYPACGVILGFLLFGDKEKKLPKAGFAVFLLCTAAVTVMAILSVLLEQPTITYFTIPDYPVLMAVTEIIVLVSSTIMYILFWTCGKEKRKNAGLSRNNIILSAGLVALYCVLFIARLYSTCFIYDFVLKQGSGSIASYNEIFLTPGTWFTIAYLAVLFPISAIMFFGEEYGWRYYLQPVLQKKFGARLGVVIVGVIWGVWHAGLDFMYYSDNSGFQMTCVQILTCISLGIFFGYAYMKSQNIWVVVIMHFINNNIIPVLGGNIQGNEFSWKAVVVYGVVSLWFAGFILAPTFNAKKQDEVKIEEAA